ncbi:MAG TPA: phage baseplate assembly protein V [Pyrinomonadaceae bacterium]|nr:phage baseplate assembly protein V [Pyrinomonadaceae bacterium]
MSEALLDNLAQSEAGGGSAGIALAPGVVTNNLDFLGLGRVKVRIPSRPSFEPWARLVGVGGSASRGFLWSPQIDDEVLVAFAENDLTSAFVLGGLWSLVNRPPVSVPTDFLTKRVLKTGLTEALGHEIELDDAEQSVTITTSTKQKVTLDPTKIEMTNLAGTVTITLDNTKQSVTISAVNKIELTSATIEFTAAKIDMTAAQVSITSTGPCSVTGLPIKLN